MSQVTRLQPKAFRSESPFRRVAFGVLVVLLGLPATTQAQLYCPDATTCGASGRVIYKEFGLPI